MTKSQMYDAIIIGAGAAGLMCALTAGKRGKKVLIIDSSNKVGKKILMSGGGRCNFTNLDIQHENYLSQNKHFFKSALSRFTQWNFIEMVEKHNIEYHEKTLGQLFCNNSSKQILTMFLNECNNHAIEIKTNCGIKEITNTDNKFIIKSSHGNFKGHSLVVATGGLSIPKMGASGFGYKVAQQFGLNVLSQSAALVPFTLIESQKNDFAELSGTSVEVIVECNGQSFRENMLFTHRGLSGPAILQISSYWNQGDKIIINLLPDIDLTSIFEENSKQTIKNILNKYFTKKLSQTLELLWFKGIINKPFAEISKQTQQMIIQQLQYWQVKPNGTEGYRTAEVTKGGVDTNEISSKTFESNKIKDLYFIGEVLDVTAHLGGYNFQWAWSSGYACGISL